MRKRIRQWLRILSGTDGPRSGALETSERAAGRAAPSLATGPKSGSESECFEGSGSCVCVTVERGNCPLNGWKKKKPGCERRLLSTHAGCGQVIMGKNLSSLKVTRVSRVSRCCSVKNVGVQNAQTT